MAKRPRRNHTPDFKAKVALASVRGKKTKRVLEERFGVVYHERTIGKLLRQIGFSHISARPQHPAQDERVVESFKKTSRPH